ncbi:MAG: hypothetical protein CFE62_001005 [Candidatus Aquirickettsiella gammari]|uniref:Glycosyltransferase RgtA/B/C/D-like domain-containing protein n=1 Tax=Candidatus Aquirickettsiella gammari TaxID=2016198 RepID=A0A370CJD8_9COXI|nr:MAG: hypothetical protein CFE62_001005 [Candidatus Aquirickettsiella gammari]
MKIKDKLIYFIEYSGLFILLLFASLIYTNQKVASLFFNADGLAAVLLLKDLFIEHGHYKDWVIPSVGHFFPSMTIFSLILLIVKNVYLYFLIAMWMIIIAMYFAVKLIYSQYFSTRKSTFCALMVTTGIFLLAFSNRPPYNILLVPFYHVEEFIAGIFLLGIQINLLNKDKLTYKDYILIALSALITFGCSVSDLLFLVQFAGPIFLTYSVFCLTRRINFFQYLLFSSPIILSSIAGLFILNFFIVNFNLSTYLSHPSLAKISFSTISAQLIVLIKTFKASSNYFIRVIYSIFYSILILSIGSMIFTKNKKNIKNHIKKMSFLILFIFSSMFFTIVSVFCLTDVHYVIDRYMFPLFYFPFLLFFIPIAYFNIKLLNSKILSYLTAAVFLYTMINILVYTNRSSFKIHMSYYPQYVRCIDKSLRGYGHNGIAQYWDANLITALSLENIKVVPVINSLYAFPWLININRFKDPINFIIIDIPDKDYNPFILDENLVYSLYGPPTKIVICEKKKILIYSRVIKLR